MPENTKNDNPQPVPRTQTLSRVLPVPDRFRDKTEDYFSRDSRMIVLEGPRGPMLARYTHTETPDPDRHKFLTTFPADYPVFEGTSVPDIANADVEACAFPVERTTDPRSSVSSGSSSASESTMPAPEDVLISHDSRSYLTRQQGIRTGPNGTHVHGGDGNGISVDRGGVRVNGQFEQPSPEAKGATQASPLFGVVPKSAVTFFASDFLPALQRIQQLIGIVQAIRFGRAWIQNLSDAMNELL